MACLVLTDDWLWVQRPRATRYNLQVRILVINGPNLNLLGEREPDIYGRTTLSELEKIIQAEADDLGIEVSFMQSNSESGILSALHEARGKFDGILINPGSFTHYSVAIADALKAVEIPAVEVHISNIFAREGFRAKSVSGRACIGVITGFGPASYILGLHVLARVARK